MDELELLKQILKRVTSSPQWWARLSYPTNDKYWNKEEQEILCKL